MRNDVTVIDHPLVRHKLTLMRRKEAPTAEFRRLMREIGALLAYEVTRDLALVPAEIETPVAAMRTARKNMLHREQRRASPRRRSRCSIS